MRTARALTVSPSMLCAGVSAPRGVSAPGECVCSRGVSALGGCLCYRGGVCSQGVSAAGGVSAPEERGVSAPGGVSAPTGSAPGGVWSWGVYPSMHWGRQPPVNRITLVRLWKHNFAPTSLRAVMSKMSIWLLSRAKYFTHFKFERHSELFTNISSIKWHYIFLHTSSFEHFNDSCRCSGNYGLQIHAKSTNIDNMKSVHIFFWCYVITYCSFFDMRWYWELDQDTIHIRIVIQLVYLSKKLVLSCCRRKPYCFAVDTCKSLNSF